MSNSCWYTIVNQSVSISQGDIFFKCPIFIPKYPTDEFNDFDFENIKHEFKVKHFVSDIIILSQACDLEIRPGKEMPNLQSVLVAALRDVRKDGIGKTKILPIAKLDRPKYFLLERSDEEIIMGYQIVQFDALYTLPWKLLNAFSQKHGSRLRLNSPYLEQLSRHFGNYFARVGVPDRIQSLEEYYVAQHTYEENRKVNQKLKPWNQLQDNEYISFIQKSVDK